MDNYKIRANLSAFMCILSLFILVLAVIFNKTEFPTIGIALMCGNALAIIAHRILFPHRWRDEVNSQ